MTDERLIAIVTGCLMAMAILLLAIVILVAFRSRKASAQLHSLHNLVSYNNHGVSPSDASSLSPPENKSEEEEDAYREPVDSIQWQQLPQQPSTTTDDCSDVTSSNYATPLHSPHMTASTMTLTGGPAAGRLAVCDPSRRQPPPRVLRDSPPPLPPPPPAHHVMQQWTGSDVAPGGSHVMESSVDEIDRERIRFIDRLEHGSYGEICLCEMLPSSSSSSSSSDLSDHAATTTTAFVVVKSFCITATTTDVNDESVSRSAPFYREVNVLRQLKANANVVRLVGVIRQVEPLCIVTEFLPLGDLQRFLQIHHRHSTDGGRWSQTHTQQTTLSYGCLIYMASQIASAMRHIESLRFIHCSLACRKCLIGERFLVKVSDFTLARCLPRTTDHFRFEEVNRKKMAAIRWMAWEAILLDRFSIKSDVWSFGVVLWEILTFGSILPFKRLTDEQVIDNARQFSDSVAGLPVHLDRPSLCPREVYDLMVQCWNSVDAQRPSFAEIHLFLRRKNVGYLVDDDLAVQNLVSELDLNDDDLD